ncbi:MAG: leishmanolysin-related zinc metalloendopeptidase, partial [Gemmatimonadaceae bacterium]
AGVAGSLNWTLGKVGGDQEVLATAQLGQTGASVKFFSRILSEFEITLRFFGNTPSVDIAASFTNAANRIHGLVTGDIPSVQLNGFDVSQCGLPAAVLNETVDDILIFATVTTIDGPGKILGSAGPCVVRSGSLLAVIGVMRFDVDDLTNIAASGRLEAVILHEMLHIVGVGTVWRSKNLIAGSRTPDPRYTGALATDRCNSSNGLAVCGLSVPIENTGAAGTIESHWREATFDSELMTGFVEAPGVPMPLSLITAASLEDYGYLVNYLAADPYMVPAVSPRLRRPPTGEELAPWEQLELPVFEVTPTGWVRPLRFR